MGSVGTGIFSTVPGLLLLYFMTDTLGIAAGLAGVAIFVPKAWDLVTDPLMGTISDRTRSRWGRRRPYLLAGGIALPLLFALLFNVPAFPSPSASFAYVIVVFLLCATAYSVFQVPYVAMPAEMTRDYDERTTLMSFRMAFMSVGILAGGSLAPLIVGWAGGGRGGYAVMSAALASLCMMAMLASFLGTRRAPHLEHGVTALGLREQVRVAFRNRPFFVLLASYFLQLVAASCLLSVVPYYAKYVLGGPETTVTILFLCLVLPTIVTMPVWVAISRRTGKLAAYLASVALFALACFTLLAPALGGATSLYARVVLMGAAYAGTQLFPFSMLPDTIDLDHAHSGLRREGIFTGIWTASEKTAMAVGALAAGAVLDASGFVESVAGKAAVQPESAIAGILVALAVVPPVLLLASLPVLRAYDLNEERVRGLSALAPAASEGGNEP